MIQEKGEEKRALFYINYRVQCIYYIYICVCVVQSDKSLFCLSCLFFLPFLCLEKWFALLVVSFSLSSFHLCFPVSLPFYKFRNIVVTALSRSLSLIKLLRGESWNGGKGFEKVFI